MYRKLYLLCSFLMWAVFAFTQNTLKVQSGATLKTTGGVVITLQDMNLDNDGTINQAPGEGVFRFTGNANNTISGNSSILFDIMQIAKTGAVKLSLLRNLEIGSSINFESGLIDLNSKNILLDPLALLNGESETSRIIGPAGGYVEIVKTLNAPSSINPGNLGAVISSTANLGTTTIRRGHVSQATGVGMGSISRYFDINPTNNVALNATLRFKYFDAELGPLNEATLVMWKSTDLTNWSNQGFTSRDIVANYVEKTGIADFSRWTLSALNNALPVQFVLFNARCDENNNRAIINWKTGQEMNASHFEVQRSENGSNWTSIGTVQAAGNSNTDQSYSFTDNNPVATGAVYRIAEMDFDGKIQYTSIIRLECGKPDNWRVWPNPVNEQLFVNLSTVTGSQAGIRVFDNRGALVREQRNNLLPGNNQLNVDMRKLPPGTYHVVVEWGNGQSRKGVKIIKQ